MLSSTELRKQSKCSHEPRKQSKCFNVRIVWSYRKIVWLYRNSDDRHTSKRDRHSWRAKKTTHLYFSLNQFLKAIEDQSIDECAIVKDKRGAKNYNLQIRSGALTSVRRNSQRLNVLYTNNLLHKIESTQKWHTLVLISFLSLHIWYRELCTYFGELIEFILIWLRKSSENSFSFHMTKKIIRMFVFYPPILYCTAYYVLWHATNVRLIHYYCIVLRTTYCDNWNPEVCQIRYFWVLNY